MRKQEMIAALERMPGDPEIEVRVSNQNERTCWECGTPVREIGGLAIDRINEYPRPEIVVIEK